ncbi:hypothetical protein WISP_64060 [Willisornis vidua]|uniref:Uncharacterized protein n=1 Tax=Willisornis vidua TaxID=1566151 RepID=A0ABQ9DAB5_9PASS|nr:hypothetical protein WISP_64060 [Willisornis vidua]
MHVHREDDSACVIVETEEKKQESEDSATVNIQASESQCQAYLLLEEAAVPVLRDLTCLGVLASVKWSFDSVQFDHTRFFLKQQEKVVCDNFKQGKIDEKEIMLFRHAALVHLLVIVRDLLLTCGLDTALGYLSKAKDIYKNILESCLNNVWRQLKIIQYSSQKKHETNPKITTLQHEMLNWMKSYGDKHSVKILIITRTDSETEKSALIHLLSRVEADLKAVDLNSEKKGSLLAYKDIISKYSLKGDTLLNLVLFYAALIELTQKSEDFEMKHFSDIISSYYLNAPPLEKTLKDASHPENQNNFNTFCPDYKQNQSLELLDKALKITGTSPMNSEALILPLNHCKAFPKSDLPSCMQKNACSSGIITRRKQNFIALSKDYEDSAHPDVTNSLHIQGTHDSSDNSSKDSEKDNFFATFNVCTPQESSKSFLEEFRDTFESPDQTPWTDSLSTGPCNSFTQDGFLSDLFVDMDEPQNLNFNQIHRESKGKRIQSPPFLWTNEKNETDSGFLEVPEFKKRRLTYERVPGRRDGQTRLKFF